MGTYTWERTFIIRENKGKYELELITQSQNKTRGSFHEFQQQEVEYTSETGKNVKSLFVVHQDGKGRFELNYEGKLWTWCRQLSRKETQSKFIEQISKILNESLPKKKPIHSLIIYFSKESQKEQFQKQNPTLNYKPVQKMQKQQK